MDTVCRSKMIYMFHPCYHRADETDIFRKKQSVVIEGEDMSKPCKLKKNEDPSINRTGCANCKLY